MKKTVSKIAKSTAKIEKDVAGHEAKQAAFRKTVKKTVAKKKSK